MVKRPTANDFFKTRRLKYQAPHLSCIDVPWTYNLEKVIDKWIESHCKHRYYLSKSIGLTQTNSLDNVLRVGFEDAKELSYFVLACPYLKYN